jgi:hypothetical protein
MKNLKNKKSQKRDEKMAENEKQKQALSFNQIKIRVKRNGMFQLLTFKLIRKQTIGGKVPYLVLDRYLDISELLKIAQEYDLPIETPSGKIFPLGKKEQDFLNL